MADHKFTDEQIATLVEQGTQNATVVVPNQDVELEIERLKDVATLTIELPKHIVESIKRTSDYRGLAIEELASRLLIESLGDSVGRPWITGTSQMSGKATVAKKITGPSFARQDR